LHHLLATASVCASFHPAPPPGSSALSLPGALPISGFVGVLHRAVHAVAEPEFTRQLEGEITEREHEPLLADSVHDVAVVVLREGDRKSTRLNSSHGSSSYAVFRWKSKTSGTAAS